MSADRLLAFLAGLAAPGMLAAQAPPPDLSDAEVAHVAVTANTIDVELARFAQTRTQNQAVQEFAGPMIRDHTAVNSQAAALAERLHLAPADNSVSQSLAKGAAQARTVLESLSGSAFDRAYLDREVTYHQAVLDALNKLLIPTTANADLRKLLLEVRPAVAAHLEHAKRLRSPLETGK